MSNLSELFKNAVESIQAMYDHPNFESHSQDILKDLSDLESIAEDDLTNKHNVLSDIFNVIFDVIVNVEKNKN